MGNAAVAQRVKDLIVRRLKLEIDPASIQDDAPLFGEGLGLDSIDLLEIALAISGKYGFQLRSDDPDNGRIFASLRALSEHVARQRRR